MKLSSAFMIFAAIYGLASAVPLSWFWFDPGQPTFKDAVAGGDPELVFSRQIKRNALMHYSVIIRDAADDDIDCEGTGGPFEYRKNQGPLIGKTLGWWVPSDPRCSRLPVGAYYGSVTWTAVRPLADLLPEVLQGPLGWILPPKTVSRDIPLFNITEVQ